MNKKKSFVKPPGLPKGIRKRGMSQVVAVVLIILIVIVAVGLVWVALLPYLDVQYGFEDAEVSIIVTQGYTVYDEGKQFGFVQIKRGPDNESIQALNIIFTIEGNSVVYRSEEVPVSNGEQVYSFNFSRDGISGTPSHVAVAPVYIVKASIHEGGVTSKVKMPVKPATVTEQDNIESERNKPAGRYVDVTACLRDPLDDDKVYTLTKDIDSTYSGTCFVFEDTHGTVLDLNGFQVKVPVNQYAVTMEDSTENVIRDGELNSAGIGIGMFNSDNNLISGIKVYESVSRGFYMDTFSTENSILSSEFSYGHGNNYIYGMDIRGSDNIFKDITANSNWATAVDARSRGVSVYLGLNNHFENIVTNDNFVTGDDAKATGFYVVASNFSKFVNIETKNNSCVNNCKTYTVGGGASGTGLGVYIAEGNVFSVIHVEDNYHSGLYSYSGCHNNSFEYVDASDNDNFGITIQNTWDTNLSHVRADNLVRGIYIVSFDDRVNDNNRLYNVTGINNENGLYLQQLSSIYKVTSPIILNSKFCNSVSLDVRCSDAATGVSGDGNVFGGSISTCVDNSWPVLGTHYEASC